MAYFKQMLSSLHSLIKIWVTVAKELFRSNFSQISLKFWQNISLVIFSRAGSVVEHGTLSYFSVMVIT